MFGVRTYTPASRVSNKYFGEMKVSGLNSLLANHVNVLSKTDVMYGFAAGIFHKFTAYYFTK